MLIVVEESAPIPILARAIHFGFDACPGGGQIYAEYRSLPASRSLEGIHAP
jgi:hypothetical protein